MSFDSQVAMTLQIQNQSKRQKFCKIQAIGLVKKKALASQKQSLGNSVKEQNPLPAEPRIKGPTKEES